jgi:hypothetical protein
MSKPDISPVSTRGARAADRRAAVERTEEDGMSTTVPPTPITEHEQVEPAQSPVLTPEARRAAPRQHDAVSASARGALSLLLPTSHSR